MNRNWFLVMLTICFSIGFIGFPALGNAAAAEHSILATTFPIYQIVRNIIQGRDGIKVDLMLPSQMGCPHDYALTPQDMQKLTKADILVVNGLGMEEFLGASLKHANPNILIIDSSIGIQETLPYSEVRHHDPDHGHRYAETEHQAERHQHGLHDEYPFEWAGAFKLDPGVYQGSFAKMDGKYASPTMKIIYVASEPKDPIRHVKEKLMGVFKQNGKPLQHGGRLRPGELYLLHFDEVRNTTEFEFKIDKAGTYVFFTEHKPSAFEAGEHFLKTAGGQDIEPVLQEPESGHTHHHAGKHHEHDRHHYHGGVNSHLFASPRMTAKLALNIAAELSKADPDGAAIYSKNAYLYAETMNKLADDMAVLGKRLKNNRIVQPHGVFDYLARDMGLQIVAVMQAHGQEPSASEMMHLVDTIQTSHAGAIFTEPQYPEKTGKVLSKETGIPVAVLDPVATGPENAPLTYYETVMRQNMKTLESTLGVK